MPEEGFTAPDGTFYPWTKSTPPTQADVDALIQYHTATHPQASAPKIASPGQQYGPANPNTGGLTLRQQNQAIQFAKNPLSAIAGNAQPQRPVSPTLLPYTEKTYGPVNPNRIPQEPVSIEGNGQKMARRAKDLRAAEQAAAEKRAFDADPWNKLPFSKEEFEKARDGDINFVRLRSGQAIPFAQALVRAQKVLGSDVTRRTTTIGQAEARGNARDMVGEFADRRRAGETAEAYAARIASLPLKAVGRATGSSIEDLTQNAPAAAAVANLVGGVIAQPVTALGSAQRIVEDPVGALKSAPDLAFEALKSVNFFDEDASSAEKVGRGLNAVLLAFGVKATAKHIDGAFSRISKAKTPEAAVQEAAKEFKVPEAQAREIVGTIEKSGAPVDWKKVIEDFDRETRKGPKVEATVSKPKVASNNGTPKIEPNVQPKIATEDGVSTSRASAPVAAESRSVNNELRGLGSDVLPPKSVETPKAVEAKVGDPNVTGTSRAIRAAERDALGLPEPERGKQLTNAEAHAKGKAAVESGSVDPESLLKKLYDKNRAATPEERGALTEGKRRILADINAKYDALTRSVGTDEHGSALQEYETALARRNDWDQKLEIVNGASGGSMQAIKIGTTLDEGNFAQVASEARLMRGKDLDAKTEKTIKGLTDQVTASQKRIAELEANEQRLTALEREGAAQKAHARSRSKTPQTVEQIQARRKAAFEAASKAWKDAGKELAGQSNALVPGVSTGYKLAKVAPHVLEIAKTYADEGVLKLSEAVAKIRDEAKGYGVDLSEDDVTRILSGDYPREAREPKTRTAGEQQLKAWQSEIKDAAKAKVKAEKDAQRNEAAEAARIEREARIAARQTTQAADRQARNARREDARVAFREEAERVKKAAQAELKADRETQARAAKELRDAAKAQARAEHQARKAEAERTFGELSRLQNSIEKMRERLESGDFEEKPKRQRDPALEREYRTQDLLRKQVRQAIENQKPQGLAEKARILQRAARLTNPTARLFDITSNTVVAADRQIGKIVEPIVDRVLFPEARKTEGAASRGWSLDRSKAVARGAVHRWKVDFKEQMTVGDPALNAKLGSSDLRTRSQALNTAVNKINRFAGSTDIPFKDTVYESVLRELADSKARVTGDDAQAIYQAAKEGTAHQDLNLTALNESVEAVFGNENMGSKIITGSLNQLPTGVRFFVDLIAPFPRIFASIAGYTTDFVPGSAVLKGPLVKGGEKGAFTLAQRRTINRLVGRNLRGAAYLAIGYYAYRNGALKGEIDKSKSFIDWGDKESALGPVGSIILMGATYAAASDLTEAQGKSLIRKTAVDLIGNQPAIEGPNRFLSGLTRDPGKAVGSAASGLIPGVIREWARRQDSFKNAGVRPKASGFVEAVESNVPFLREGLPRKE